MLDRLYRIPVKYIYAFGIVILMLATAGAFYSSTASRQPVADSSVLSVQQECQIAISYEGRSSDDIAFLTTCIHALSSPTSTPTPSTTTVVPTTTAAPPTTVHPTTAPPTTTTTTAPATPTATPTVTPTGGTTVIKCAAQPSKCGWPDATNTGVPAGTVLTPFTGTITAGMTINAKTLDCQIIGVPNVTIKNSIIKGECYFTIRANSSGLIIQDSEISCDNSTGTGVGGKGFSIQRVEITGCENGLSTDANVSVTDSYIHDMYLGTGGHTDGIQVYSQASNIAINHNTIYNEDSGGTSAIISDLNNMTNISITNNLMAGGSFTLYCPTKNSGPVTGNRISKLFSPKGGQNGPWIHCELAVPHTGNVWDETNAAL